MDKIIISDQKKIRINKEKELLLKGKPFGMMKQLWKDLSMYQTTGKGLIQNPSIMMLVQGIIQGNFGRPNLDNWITRLNSCMVINL